MRVRRRARIIAIQALYELDLTNHSPAVVVEERINDAGLPPQGIAFVHQLIQGVLQHKRYLDKLIQRCAPEWPIEQMAPIDRNVLRLALFEFSVDGQTPVKVAINEAVELAKLFGSDSAPRFINGVLGSLAGANLPAPENPPSEQTNAGKSPTGAAPKR